MHFRLTYEGNDGDLLATLYCDGKCVAEEQGFRDKKEVEKWAERVARDHKVENTPAPTHNHKVYIEGNKTFSV